jgi:hypothetical protein
MMDGAHASRGFGREFPYRRARVDKRWPTGRPMGRTGTGAHLAVMHRGKAGGGRVDFTDQTGLAAGSGP